MLSWKLLCDLFHDDFFKTTSEEKCVQTRAEINLPN